MNVSRARLAGAVLVAAALVAVGQTPAAGGGTVHQSSTVYEFVGMADVGDAHLSRNSHGVTMKISTALSGQLVEFGGPLDAYWSPGDATTVWFVVFNDPEGCIDGCGEDDVLAAFAGDNRGKVGVLQAAGHVAGGSKFRAAGRLNENDSDRLIFGMPLMDALTAEIHLIVRSHGPARTLTGPQLAQALHSVDGGCDVNTCGDPQFAVFLAP